MRFTRVATAGVAALALLLAVGAAQARAVSLDTVGGYGSPVFITSDPSNPDRLFVVERAGRIQLTTPSGTSQFLDISSRVESGFVEQGLLSMAFAPDYATSGRFYVFFNARGGGDLQIAELRASGNAADPGTYRPVITIPHRNAPNHNGGQIAFGPDGYLYIGTGDGGGSNDNTGSGNNAQNLSLMLGKLLRIDPRPSGGAQYSVPPGNPFVGVTNVAPEIWSYGLRNPYRFSFDRETGALTIGDVGQGAWEEVNYATQPNAGRAVDFGWRCREGAHPNPTGSVACTLPNPVDPVLEYDHDAGGCAITGGYVVRDPGLDELRGRYVYADYCIGQLRSAVLATPAASDDRELGIRVDGPSSFGEDACGRLYVASLGGVVSRFVDGTPTDCSFVGGGPPIDPNARCAVVIDGSGGKDRLRGGAGGQRISGKGGNDKLKGGAGEDCLDGGAGDDRLTGGSGGDRLVGGSGDDRIFAADGKRDVVSCGKGEDRAEVDRKDRVRGCERVRKVKS